jgi:hypothetical protein
VSVQNFISAFANTETAKRTQSMLQTPPVVNEKAEDPLVRGISVANAKWKTLARTRHVICVDLSAGCLVVWRA